MLEPAQLLLHLSVDLQVAGHDHLHLLHVVVYVTIFLVLPLYVLYELTLFSDHVRHLFEVFEMVGSQSLLLLHDVVYLLVEGKQVLVGHSLTSAGAESHAQVI